jgi:hypothetical protein
MLNGVNLDDQADLRPQIVQARLVAEQWLARGAET